MRLFLLILAVVLMIPAMNAQETVSTPESRSALSMTVYNGGFAVVREVRPVSLGSGMNTVRFEGVPARIDPTSLSIVSISAPGTVSVREQNYQANLINTENVLDAAVGERVRLVWYLDNRLESEEGVLLSQPGQGTIVRLDDGRVLVNPQASIELTSLPPTLRSRPSLLWMLNASQGGNHDLQASYMTEGVNWKANYVAVVNEEETTVDLTGWVTLTNGSGARYENADLQLMAGDVRRVEDQDARRQFDDRMVARAEAAPEPAFEEEAFFEYHLYTLDGTTTLAENETKQMELLAAQQAGVDRRLVFDGAGAYFPVARQRRPGQSGQDISAAIVLELENSETNQMGMPLPAGVVRVYKADANDNLQFVGEDRIDHTPRNETVRLYIGDAFDVVGTRRVVSDDRISDNVRELTVEVEVRNRKETAADVSVVERLRGDWKITNATHSYERLDAYTAQFDLRLAPDETQTVRFTARMTW